MFIDPWCSGCTSARNVEGQGSIPGGGGSTIFIIAILMMHITSGACFAKPEGAVL